MTRADSFDAVVIGGGPAGSSTARTLTAAGLKVLVMDKSKFPRDKVCAGWITPQVVTLTDLDLQEYQQGRTLQPIRRFRTGLLGEKIVTTSYDDVISYGILRREFDHYLLQRSGARLRLGEPVDELRRDGNEWRINSTIRAPLLIGAGGHTCPVARRLNPLGLNKGPVVVAQEAEFRLMPHQLFQCKVEGDAPELYFLPELDGYGWCVRKGDYLNIGLGRTHNQKLGAYVSWFRRYLIEQGRIPEDIPENFRGHAYRLVNGLSNRKVIDDGVMLVGDAVGLAYPQSGEGIRNAIESGIIAAQTALTSTGNYRTENLQGYVTQLNEHYGLKTAGVPQYLPQAVRHFVARLLLSNRFLTRRILLNDWFLQTHQ